MNQERMYGYLARLVAETIKRQCIAEFAMQILTKPETNIAIEDLKEMGWRYIMIDEQTGGYGQIHLLTAFANYDEATSMFDSFVKDIESKKYNGYSLAFSSQYYNYDYVYPADLRCPETSKRRSKYYEEPKPIPDFIIRESKWDAYDKDFFTRQPCFKSYRRYCLIDLEKAYEFYRK